MGERARGLYEVLVTELLQEQLRAIDPGLRPEQARTPLRIHRREAG